MGKPAISYATRSDGTQQAEIATLANLYAFVIKSSQAKKEAAIAAGSDNPESRRGGRHDLVKGSYEDC